MITTTSNIEWLRSELIKSISGIVFREKVREIEISPLVKDPTFVIHYDSSGVPHEYRVIKVKIGIDYLILTGYNSRHETVVEIDSRHDIGASMVEWLNSVLGNIAETISMNKSRKNYN